MFATAEITVKNSFLSSGLDNIETTASPAFPSTFQKYRRRFCEPEWQRSKTLYQHVDEAEGSRRSEQFLGCRSTAYFARHIDTGLVRVISNACHLRWCPICSNARSMFLSQEVADWLKSVKNPKFLTLTLEHTNAPLEHQVKWLYDHFRKFRQRKFLREKVQGGIWFFQCKKNEQTGQWHPHLHCVLDAEYIPKQQLSNEWLKQTLTSYIVDIAAITDVRKVAEYVARYCARPCQLATLNDTEIYEVFSAFHKRRLCGTWGSGRSTSLRPGKPADKDCWEQIGNYSEVVAQSGKLYRCNVILKAWQTNTSIPRGLIIKAEQTDEQYLNNWLPHIGYEDLAGNFEEFK